MAQVFGEKSEYLIKKDHRNRNIGAILLLFCLIITLAYFINMYKNPHTLRVGIYLLFSAFFLTFIYFLKRLIDHKLNTSDNFYFGRKGEYKICDELTKLPEDFIIFQDVKIQKAGGNIDFVVIGPTGIFAIEVKSHKKEITLNGKDLLQGGKPFEKNVISQALYETYDLLVYLKQKTGKEFFINPVLAFSSPYASMHFGLKPVYKNIRVVQKRFLNQLILKNSSNMLQSDIDAVKNELKKIVKI